jgi:hypothetical protein
MNRLAMVAVCIGCAGTPARSVGPLRFKNAEPVQLVNDRKPVKSPSSFDTGLVAYYMREDLAAPLDRVLTVDGPVRAANVNSLGEVPSSAWFTTRRPTPEDVRRGPGGDGPDRSEPWKVTGVKVGGAAIGFTIVDARSDSYLLKFDERGHPEAETAADVIVQRLTWAFGYNVPENNVVTLTRDDLVLDANAEVKFLTGKSRPMTTADLEQYLALVDSQFGKYRGLVSKVIPGKLLGGIEPEGVRKGDPNDRVPHELRRDLRGQRVLWAWVNHHDLKSQNSLAAYTDDKYIKWYVLDFGDSLGVGALTSSIPRLGYRTLFSVSGFLKSLFTFGLRVEPWERTDHIPRLRGLGIFESEEFDPATWVPNHNWRPTDSADKLDELWGAEILMRFTRAHIEAAVDAGSYSDARTRDYIVRTLLERQRKIGHYAFSRVAPLTAFEARSHGDGLQICFDDLWLLHGFGVPARTSYRTRSFDYAGKPLATGAWMKPRTARACVAATGSTTEHGYTIVDLEVHRGDDSLPAVFVHVARGADGVPRVIGLDRR